MMANTNLQSIDPRILKRNPENPRLIFRADDLQHLEDSIKARGILVPLTVYEDSGEFFIMDGERRWRCAIRLALSSVPVIVQPKPDRMQNIMMMFAIHNARRDWDPLPTAYKLRDLEEMFQAQEGRLPTEIELAELASITRGEVRRLKKLLALPSEYREELMAELEKPRSQQLLTVDHVLEATRGAEALAKRGVVDPAGEERLRRAVVDKFRNKKLNSTVEPRKLARIARAVERDEISSALARQVVEKIVTIPDYTVDDAFTESAAQADAAHAVEILLDRVTTSLDVYRTAATQISPELKERLLAIRTLIDELLRER